MQSQLPFGLIFIFICVL
uniref:Uncharacterized protein n=1 Tax=Anguilla anguilla TaxID=7936 RepID=A0A0E9SLP4_ANGAN